MDVRGRILGDLGSTQKLSGILLAGRERLLMKQKQRSCGMPPAVTVQRHAVTGTGLVARGVEGEVILAKRQRIL